MSYVDLLKEKKNIICLGLDPDIEKIPLKEEDDEKNIFLFYRNMLDAAVGEKLVSTVKPNYAFYAQYGFPGLRALKKIIEFCKEKDLIVILDAKRGDIGNTAKAYAKEVFEFWDADAVTVSPFLGSDSLIPFLEYCKKGKGVYILLKTSNIGANDLQNLKVGDKFVYEKLGEKILEWHQPGTGVVIGATYPEELEKLSEFFVKSKKEVPILIPGVGKQGGNASDVVKILRKTNNNLLIQRINSSSGINYAYEKYKLDYVESAVKALKELKDEIGKL